MCASAQVVPFQQSRALLVLAEIRDALQEVRSVDDAISIIDKAEALRVCVRKAGLSLEVVNLAAEQKLRAEREAGRLLREANLNGGDRRSEFHDGRVKLDDIGVTAKQSHRWQRVASLDDDLFEQELESLREREKEITTSHFLKLAARQPTPEPESDEEPVRNSGEFVRSLHELISAGRKFRTIYADPPWQYGNQATRASTDNHYETMAVEDICLEPVSELAEDDAHLHLWTTNAFLFDAKTVMENWGFEYKSCFVWCKKQLGIGNYWRVSHEFLLFGVRGSLKFRDRSLQSYIVTDRTKHSQKPWEVRQLVEKASPGPYLEMYGREALPDSPWTVYGNQVEERMF